MQPLISRILLNLKGKTIATQLYSVDHMFLLTLLEENGMSEKGHQVVDMSITGIQAMLS